MAIDYVSSVQSYLKGSQIELITGWECTGISYTFIDYSEHPRTLQLDHLTFFDLVEKSQIIPFAEVLMEQGLERGEQFLEVRDYMNTPLWRALND